MVHVVVAGAGHAGGMFVNALRTASFIGDVTIVGEEKWPPYERPQLSKALLAGRIEPEKTFLRPAAAYPEINVDLRTATRVEAVDRPARSARLSDGTRLGYDILVLATGARARKLRPEQTGAAEIFYLRDLDDMFALRNRLADGVRLTVIGAGLIGLEIAATARTIGCDVTVLEIGDGVLNRVLPAEIATHYADLHARNGVKIFARQEVASILPSSNGTLVSTTDGLVIEADLVAVGIGCVPNSEIAAAAGLPVDDGVLTDEYGRTEDPAIYAIGDVTRHYNPIAGQHIRLESWQNAQDQAIAIAAIVSGGDRPYASVPWFWTDQYDVNLQAAGFGGDHDELVWRGGFGPGGGCVFYVREGRLAGGACVNSPRNLRPIRKLIASGVPVDTAALQDPEVPLSGLARGLSATGRFQD